MNRGLQKISTIPVIIDTDPGVDDAIAIFLAAACPELQIVAATTVAGNVSLDTTTRNALGIRDMLGGTFPLYRGAERPIMAPFMDASDIHGAGGLGNYRFGEARGDAAPGHAWDALYEHAKACGRAVIVALGPLTNIAIALLRHPDLGRYVTRVVSMGGGIGYGNTAPYSEFNYWCDPLAARIVFESSLDVWMVGLNATRLCTLDDAEMDALGSASPGIDRFLKIQRTYYVERLRSKGLSGGFHIPDAVAMACAADSRVLRFEECPVDIVSDDGPQRGRSIVDLRHRRRPDAPKARRAIHVALDADKGRFIGLLDRLQRLHAGGGRA